MGIRTAKLENEDVWIVYQSVTDACFSPMFYDELSANLYALHWYKVGALSDEWQKEHTVGEDVMRFIRLLYGEELEKNDENWDVLAEVTSCRTRHSTLEDLWLAFATWRKDQSKPPVFLRPKEEEA